MKNQDALLASHHLGRIDNQVKVLGNRVELEEVEGHLREMLGTDRVATLTWPFKDGSAAGLIAFHCGSTASAQTSARCHAEARAQLHGSGTDL